MHDTNTNNNANKSNRKLYFKRSATEALHSAILLKARCPQTLQAYTASSSTTDDSAAADCDSNSNSHYSDISYALNASNPTTRTSAPSSTRMLLPFVTLHNATSVDNDNFLGSSSSAELCQDVDSLLPDELLNESVTTSNNTCNMMNSDENDLDSACEISIGNLRAPLEPLRSSISDNDTDQYNKKINSNNSSSSSSDDVIVLNMNDSHTMANKFNLPSFSLSNQQQQQQQTHRNQLYLKTNVGGATRLPRLLSHNFTSEEDDDNSNNNNNKLPVAPTTIASRPFVNLKILKKNGDAAPIVGRSLKLQQLVSAPGAKTIAISNGPYGKKLLEATITSTSSSNNSTSSTTSTTTAIIVKQQPQITPVVSSTSSAAALTSLSLTSLFHNACNGMQSSAFASPPASIQGFSSSSLSSSSSSSSQSDYEMANFNSPSSMSSPSSNASSSFGQLSQSSLHNSSLFSGTSGASDFDAKFPRMYMFSRFRLTQSQTFVLVCLLRFFIDKFSFPSCSFFPLVALFSCCCC